MYDILEIHEAKACTKTLQAFWILCTELKGKKTEKDWKDSKHVYDWCQECVERGLESENFLFKFIRENPEEVPIQLAKQVGTWAGKSLETLFPEGVRQRLQGATCKPKPVVTPGRHQVPGGQVSSAPSPKEDDLCGHDHNCITSYKEVVENYYFREGRRYSQVACRGCRQPFGLGSPKKGLRGIIPLPKEPGGKPCYACIKFEAGSILCGNMLCSGCYFHRSKITGRSKRRRSSPHKEEDDDEPLPSAKKLARQIAFG